MKAPREAHSHRDLGKLLSRGLLVLALVLQGYISQAHRHDSIATAFLAAAVASGVPTGSPAQPIDSDGRDHRCFICHLSGHGSTSVLPQAIVLAVFTASLIAYRGTHDPFDSCDAPSAYSSRAPPSLFVQA